MSGSAVVELGVVNHEGSIFVIERGAVVPLSAFAHSLEAPVVVGTHQFHAAVGLSIGTIVQPIAIVIAGIVVGGIEVETVRSLAAEGSHLIASLGNLVPIMVELVGAVLILLVATRCKASVAHEEVIVIADVLDVGAFAAAVISSGNALAEVGVGEGAPSSVCRQVVGVGVVAESCLFIQFEDEDASTP